MGKLAFNNYGEYAQHIGDNTIVSGRYPVQKTSERLIVKDIIFKLQIHPEDTLLDIGSGVGTTLIPLSFFVQHITGIDHEKCIRRLNDTYSSNNITLLAGDFLDLDMGAARFDKIIIYSVLHCLRQQDVMPFIEKAASLLKDNGIMLLGDIPNSSLKARFLASASGIKFQEEWNRLCAQQPRAATIPPGCTCSTDSDMAVFDDAFVMHILSAFRDKGFNAFVLPQDGNLPFGHTREDIILERP